MRINIVGKRTAPDPPYTGTLVPASIEVVAPALGAIWLRYQKYWWASPGDWINGRDLLTQLSEGLLMDIGATLHNDNIALYSMLDARLGGVSREVTGGSGTLADPIELTPPIPFVVDPNSFDDPGMQYLARYTTRIAENALEGVVNDDFSDDRNFRQQLADLIAGLDSSGVSNEDILNELILILGAL